VRKVMRAEQKEARRKTQDARRKTQDARRKTQDARQKYREARQSTTKPVDWQSPVVNLSEPRNEVKLWLFLETRT